MLLTNHERLVAWAYRVLDELRKRGYEIRHISDDYRTESITKDELAIIAARQYYWLIDSDDKWNQFNQAEDHVINEGLK